MFRDNALSEIQISLLFSAWAFFVMIFQPIVDVFGDRFSRKNILIIGQFSKLLCFLIFMLIPNFYGYLFGFALWGIQWAIEASVGEAFLYDELRVLKEKEKYVSASGTALAFYNAGMLVSCAGSIFAAKFGYSLTLAFCAICMLISALLIASIKMTQPIRYRHEKDMKLIHNLKSGIKTILKTKGLWFIILVFACVCSLAEQDDFIGLLGEEIGVPLLIVGALFAVSRIAEIIGGYVAKFFQHFSNRSLGAMVIITGVLFATLYISEPRFIIWALLFLGNFTYAVSRTLLNARIQCKIPSGRRSIILSFIDMLGQMAIIVFYTLMAIGAHINGYKFGFFIVGTIVFSLGLLWVLYSKFLTCDSRKTNIVKN